jgi:hypothetical protein
MCVWCRVVGGSVYNNEACIRFHQALASQDQMVRIIDVYIHIDRMSRLGLAVLQAQPNRAPPRPKENPTANLARFLVACQMGDPSFALCTPPHPPLVSRVLLTLSRTRCSWC